MGDAYFVQTADGPVLTEAGRTDTQQALVEYLTSCEIPQKEWPAIIERWKARGGNNLDLEREIQQWLYDHHRKDGKHGILHSATSPYIDDEDLAWVGRRFRRKAIGHSDLKAHLEKLDRRDRQQSGAAVKPGKSRRGRLPKQDSEAYHTAMLALLGQHPTLKDDPAELARLLPGVTVKTIRRWLEKDEMEYRESQTYRRQVESE